MKIFIFVSLIFVCFSGDNCWEDDEVDLGGFSFVPMMVFEIFEAYIFTNDGFWDDHVSGWVADELVSWDKTQDNTEAE